MAEENLSAQKLKKSCLGQTLTKKHSSGQVWKKLSFGTTTFFFSERLFLEAGNFYELKRNRLLPKTGEKLLFLQYNLKKQ